MPANGLQLPTVGGLELQICLDSTSMKRIINHPICTNPPIVGRCCYQQAFFLFKRQNILFINRFCHLVLFVGLCVGKVLFLKVREDFLFYIRVGESILFYKLRLERWHVWLVNVYACGLILLTFSFFQLFIFGWFGQIIFFGNDFLAGSLF